MIGNINGCTKYYLHIQHQSKMQYITYQKQYSLCYITAFKLNSIPWNLYVLNFCKPCKSLGKISQLMWRSWIGVNNDRNYCHHGWMMKEPWRLTQSVFCSNMSNIDVKIYCLNVLLWYSRYKNSIGLFDFIYAC